MMAENTIHNRDALDGLGEMQEGTIDAIVSDPPYQLSSMVRARPDQSGEGSYGKEVPFSRQQSRVKAGFMGKTWDVLPDVPLLKGCLRVLKPGAFALWFMTPRQDSMLEFLTRLRNAGFVISFSSINWAYASGFPKAMNISKAVDKRLGLERKGIKKEGAGSKGNTFPLDKEYETGEPVSAAAGLQGSYGGMQLKPAYEPIIVSMKPLSEKTYVAQALSNRKGITWLDEARIPYQSESDMVIDMVGKPRGGTSGLGKIMNGSLITNPPSPKGRFPANLIVSDRVLDTGHPSSSSSYRPPDKGGTGNSLVFAHPIGEDRGYDDSGDFSRYFSLDAWWEEKVKELPKEARRTFPFLITPKASTGERNEGLSSMPDRYDVGVYGDGIGNVPKEDGQRPNPYKNIHPTTKPISITSWLITLVSEKGDTILDPFMGSGTTAIAAYEMGRRFVGFEREEEYWKIATERIRHHKRQVRL